MALFKRSSAEVLNLCFVRFCSGCVFGMLKGAMFSFYVLNLEVRRPYLRHSLVGHMPEMGLLSVFVNGQSQTEIHSRPVGRIL